jgi:hypothetical protein
MKPAGLNFLQKHTSIVCLLVLASAASAAAQERKGIRFWNLTRDTVVRLQLASAGTTAWGPDQCKNDRDGTVDHDERLRVTGVEPGRYDVKLADRTGRECIVRNVDVKDGAVFSIEEKQLSDCGKVK